MNLPKTDRKLFLVSFYFFLFFGGFLWGLFYFFFPFSSFFLGGLVFCLASELKRLTKGQMSTRVATKKVAGGCNQKEGTGKGQGNGNAAGIC